MMTGGFQPWARRLFDTTRRDNDLYFKD